MLLAAGVLFLISVFFLSLVCDADFGLNTLDSELVLCLHLIYQNAGYCF